MPQTEVLPDAPLPPAVVSLTGARVLIAEDNAVNLEVASFYLQDLGCISSTAVNGAIAVDLVQQQPFDIVLMDCQMPVMDGFAALRAIRRFEAAAGRTRTSILAVTAADDDETRTQCRQAGFDGFLSKPFTTDGLRAAMLDPTATLRASVTAAPLKAAPAHTAPIDAAVLRSFVDDFGLDTAPALIGSFVTLLTDSLPRLDAIIAAHNTAGLQALAHKMAGAAGMAGASHLAQLARTTELACKRGTFVWSPDVIDIRTALIAALAGFEPLSRQDQLELYLAQPTSH